MAPQMQAPLAPAVVARGLADLWSPRVIGELDDAYLKVAKVQGVFGWHAHAEEDELFYVLDGRLRIEMEQATVELGAGELFVVPRGVRHNPSADEECLILLIERKSTAHSGDTVTAWTRTIEEQLG